jgi:hypothetical protein
MSDAHLMTYLNGHLAGSTVALELLGHLERAVPDSPTSRLARELAADVGEDRQQLERLIDELCLGRGPLRATTAWLGEKLTEMKLRLDDRSAGPLRILEALELVGIGIHGKLSLWTALRTAAESVAALRALDYDRLVERAREQRRRVEAARLEAAREALAAEPQPASS